MANDKSRPGSRSPGGGASRKWIPAKAIENKNEIMAIKNAVDHHLRELDSPAPARTKPVSVTTTDKTKNALVSNPGQVKPREGSPALPTNNSTKSNGCGCLLTLAVLAFFTALAFPPFWFVFIILLFALFGSS